ncbi:hypothetical protein CVT24_004024 [Panaeolus cyanescens]|uniref:Fluoride ion transporter CrcB n=1 Tax=Panaeolus cyanescens TaxID=181874 RepID=A0A409Y6E9_9AGAR|nr:hypothetical protein CVT24_004024 [Panaeolus cyanescens]
MDHSNKDIDRSTNHPETEETAETIERPPSSSQGVPPQKIYGPLSFPVLALLMPASVFGVLARLGLLALMNYDGHSVFPLAYVQAVGCLIMGFAVKLKPAFGFCGSLTTFSTWQLDVFNAWINANNFSRSGLGNFLDGIGLSTITLSLALASLSFGQSIASILAPHIHQFTTPARPFRYGLSCISVLTYAATLLPYFLLPSRLRHEVTAALVFSYPGALLRYLLSVFLNPRSKAVPLGTLTANSLGTVLLAAFHVLQSTTIPPSPNRCAILQGLSDGLCGSLTTVSTFAAEVYDLEPFSASRYVLISWGCGQILMVLVFGTSLWTGRVEKIPTCIYQ